MDRSPVSFAASRPLTDVILSLPDGSRQTLPLCHAVTLPAVPLSPYALCRLCLPRLPLKTLEKVLLAFILEEAECGLTQARSYTELGTCLCRSAHSIETAMGTLRRHGLVLTGRAGREGARLTVECSCFVRWARIWLQEPSPKTEVPKSFQPVLPTRRRTRQKRPLARPSAKSDTSIVQMHENASTPVSAPPAAADETLALSTAITEARETDRARFTQPDGTLYPGVYLDDSGLPHFDAASGAPLPPCLQSALTDDVDPTAEIDATRAAAGRALSEEDDTDEISFGAETADSDIGSGVRINPDV